MKRYLIFLFTLFVSQNVYSQSDWKWISPDPPNKMVYSSIIADNKAYFWCEYNSVIKLDLETESFEMLPIYAPYDNVSLGCCNTQGIAFIDSLRGFITDAAYGEFKTTDGGMNWITTYAGSNGHLIVFGTKQIGWKVGNGGLYKTMDAGESWTALTAPFYHDGGIFSKMFALNQNQLWILKSSYNNGSGAGIWYTSNGGTSWVTVNTGLQSTNQNQVFYTDLKMSASGIGFIIGSEYKPQTNSREGVILKTIDMGQTWTVIRYPEERFQNLLFISENEWVVLGNQGNSYDTDLAIQRKTTDAGISWVFSSPLSEYASRSYFYDGVYAQSKDAIYVCAVDGIYKSTDRGTSYQRLTSETDVIVSEIALDSKPINSDSQLGVAWLKWNTKPYLITYDGGQTWHKKSLPQSMGYIWLVGIAEQVIYMITNQDKLYKSTDFGETWNQLNVPVYYSGLQALSVYNKDVVVLNAYKNLVSTTDGGSSWILGPTLGNVWLQETDISEPGYIAAVGTYYDSLAEKGCFFNSSDFGLSWHIFDTDNEMKEITMVDEQIGFALGEKKIYKTTDRAQSWKIILSRGGNWYDGYSCFAFKDTLNGIVDSDEGTKITTDGGRSWIKKDYRIPFPGVDRMEYNARGDLFMIAGGSMIMLPAAPSSSPNINNTLNESVSESYLSSSFPNPFNSASTIKYYIPSTSQVTIKIFNTLGEEIETLVDEVKSTGTYQVTWNAKDLTSGVYFYRMQAGSFVQTKKMILLK